MRILFIIICIASSVACSNSEQESSLSTKEKNDYTISKENIAETERKKPLQFLTIEGKDKRNKLFGTTVYKANIKNTASVVSYHKIRIKLLYYNSNGTLVENHEEELEEAIEPGDAVKFVARYKTPKDTDSVKATIMSAKAL